jgi:O-antigen/teichoic acid export membrane protein
MLASVVFGAGRLPFPVLPVALLLAAILAFDQASALRMAFLRALDRPVLAQLPEMLLRPLAFLLGLGAAYALWRGQLHLGHVLGALAVASAVGAVAGQGFLRGARTAQFAQTVPEYRDREWLRSGNALAFGYGITLVGAYVDQLVLGLFVPIADVGHYRVALSLSLLCALPWQAFNLIAGERFAALRASGHALALRRTARFLGLAAWLATLLPVAVLFAWGDVVIGLLYGAEFARALAPTLLLAGAYVLATAFGLPRTLLVMGGHERVVLRTSAWALGLNIAACFLLVPAYGLLGAACANAVSSIFWSACLHLQARHRHATPAATPAGDVAEPTAPP